MTCFQLQLLQLERSELPWIFLFMYNLHIITKHREGEQEEQRREQ